MAHDTNCMYFSSYPATVGQARHPRQQRTIDHTECSWRPGRSERHPASSASRLSEFAVSTGSARSIPTTAARSSVWPSTHAIRSACSRAHQWHPARRSAQCRQTVSKISARLQYRLLHASNQFNCHLFLELQSILISHERRGHHAAGTIPTRRLVRTRNSTARAPNQYIGPWRSCVRGHNIESNQICVHRRQGLCQSMGYLAARRQKSS